MWLNSTFGPISNCSNMHFWSRFDVKLDPKCILDLLKLNQKFNHVVLNFEEKVCGPKLQRHAYHMLHMPSCDNPLQMNQKSTWKWPQKNCNYVNIARRGIRMRHEKKTFECGTLKLSYPPKLKEVSHSYVVNGIWRGLNLRRFTQN